MSPIGSPDERYQFGLQTNKRRVSPAEQGISEVLTDLYRRFAEPLDEDTFFQWHHWLMQGRGDLNDVGAYRTHGEPMQVVSGATYAPKVHFEAPPSDRVPEEMKRFCAWFNETVSLKEHAIGSCLRSQPTTRREIRLVMERWRKVIEAGGPLN